MKKALIVIAVIVAGILIAAFIAVNAILNRGMPVYNKQIKATGVEKKVEIYFDRYKIPHIFADTEKDAYYALGYMHAQERLFQMDLIRHLISGRMCEVFGDQPFHQRKSVGNTMSALDRFHRTIGFAYLGKTLAPKLKPEDRAKLEAYAAGVNAYINSGKNLPVEFMLLGYKPEPWKVEDVLTMGRYIGWSLSSNWDFEMYRLWAISELGLERGWELVPRHVGPGPYIIPKEDNPFFGKRGKKIDPLYMPPGMPLDAIPEKMFSEILELRRAIAESPFTFVRPYASNNWAVAGSRSESGAPILSNDPHLINMLPSVFYEAHLKTKDGMDVIGVSFPGMPFIVLGHNRTLAWAATTTRADNQDLFIEKTNPDNPAQYWDPVAGGWSNFEKRTEVIKIKGKGKAKGTDLKFDVRSTRHGPVINDVLYGVGKDAPPVALNWTGNYYGEGPVGFMKAARAKNAKEFMAAVEIIDVPIQNWVFADTEGNIGYYAAGRYPLRPEGCDGTMPVRGDTTDCDWQGWVPAAETPQMLNPKQGYVVTANNKVVDESQFPHTVTFTSMLYRAERIEQLLKSKQKLTPDDMRKFQKDTYMKHAERLLPRYLAAYEAKGDKSDKLLSAAVKELKKWNFNADTDSIAQSIFIAAYGETVDLTYEDDIPKGMLEYMKSSLMEFSTGMDLAIDTGIGTFFDDVRTKDKVETRDDILAAALKSAVALLAKKYGSDMNEWQWGKLHVLNLSHPFSAKKPLDKIFKNYPVPVPGTGDTIFAEAVGYEKRGEFPVVGGPAFRQVIDMSRVDDATMVIDTGQSGHIRSKQYLDQNPLWLNGEGVPMLMDMDKIKKAGGGLLILEPK